MTADESVRGRGRECAWPLTSVRVAGRVLELLSRMATLAIAAQDTIQCSGGPATSAPADGVAATLNCTVNYQFGVCNCIFKQAPPPPPPAQPRPQSLPPARTHARTHRGPRLAGRRDGPTSHSPSGAGPTSHPSSLPPPPLRLG